MQYDVASLILNKAYEAFYKTNMSVDIYKALNLLEQFVDELYANEKAPSVDNFNMENDDDIESQS